MPLLPLLRVCQGARAVGHGLVGVVVLRGRHPHEGDEEDGQDAARSGDVAEGVPVAGLGPDVLEDHGRGQRAEAPGGEGDAAACGGRDRREGLDRELAEDDEAHGGHPVEAQDAEVVDCLQDPAALVHGACVAEAGDAARGHEEGEGQHHPARQQLGDDRGAHDAEHVGRPSQDDLPAGGEAVALLHDLWLCVHAAVVEKVDDERRVGEDGGDLEVASAEDDPELLHARHLARVLRLRLVVHVHVGRAVHALHGGEGPLGRHAVTAAGEVHGGLRQDEDGEDADDAGRDGGHEHQLPPREVVEVGVLQRGQEGRVRVADVEEALRGRAHGDAPLLRRDLAEQRRHRHVPKGHEDAKRESQGEQDGVVNRQSRDAAHQGDGEAADADRDPPAQAVAEVAAGDRADEHANKHHGGQEPLRVGAEVVAFG
mmetsp:Transcript_23408/g.73756  ORF Transcript_23408/g.73756 Transcript_23408/m.73756 type:complete len:427 (+) Transcript_23408:132-1412(+)